MYTWIIGLLNTQALIKYAETCRVGKCRVIEC